MRYLHYSNSQEWLRNIFISYAVDRNATAINDIQGFQTCILYFLLKTVPLSFNVLRYFFFQKDLTQVRITALPLLTSSLKSFDVFFK